MPLVIAWRVLYIGWIASEFLILLGTRRRAAAATDHDRGSLRILWLVIVTSIFAGSWYGAAHAPTIFQGAPWVRHVAVALLALALALR